LTAAALLLSSAATAGEKKNPAATPSPRMGKGGKPDAGWMKRHEGFVVISKKGDVNVLFLGDSITDAWSGQKAWKKYLQPLKAANVDQVEQFVLALGWKKYFQPLKAANFGIGGDRTQHVLWRIEQGQLDGIKAKVAVVMIGTNNSNNQDNTEAEILEGVAAIVQQIRTRQPDTKILLLGIFPRGKTFSAQRGKILQVNEALARLDDGSHIFYLDLGSQYIENDGSISKSIMPDYLHPNEAGYRIWANATEPKLKQFLGE
jgi:lysophospholipase L1-like esterase